MEPVNMVDKYAVCVKKNDAIVGHLPHSKNGKKEQIICRTQTGKEVNPGDARECNCLACWRFVKQKICYKYFV